MKRIIILGMLFLSNFYATKNFSIFAQEFEVDSLITIPGNNFSFDVIKGYPSTYISWINELDSVFTVYYKEISLKDFTNNFLVSRSTIFKSNVQISSSGIAWQEYNQTGWRINFRPFTDIDSLGELIIIADSLENDPMITMSSFRIAWIDNGKLLVKGFYQESESITVIDSLDCFYPNIDKHSIDTKQSSEIIYEKYTLTEECVYFTKLNKAFSSSWEINKIGASKDVSHPNICIGGSITFQSKNDSLWQIEYSYLDETDLDTLKNNFYNIENPYVFTYPIPTGYVKYKLPFFITFDSDSITNNKEIFYYAFGYDAENKLLNISNSKGNDYKPKVTYVSDSSGTYVAIIWLHEDNAKQDIWFATTMFNPLWTNVDKEEITTPTIFLSQNYPNPFNPVTKIKYSIPTSPILPLLGKERDGVRLVTLKIFDILGKEVATLVNEEKPAGNYEIEFDGSKLTSGVYFYQLSTYGGAGSFVETKKLVLMK